MHAHVCVCVCVCVCVMVVQIRNGAQGREEWEGVDMPTGKCGSQDGGWGGGWWWMGRRVEHQE